MQKIENIKFRKWKN